MRRVISVLCAGFVLAVMLATPLFGARAQEADTITAIAVEGVQRVEAETVRSYLLVREGDEFDPIRIDRSLKSLFATGLFADVSLSQEGSTLVVRVTENPVINRIAFEGNKRLDDAELTTEVSLKPRVIYTRSKVQTDVNRIQTLYQRSGRFAVTVEPKIIQLPQNRVDLVFEIDEGALTEVQNIRFIGNRAFDDSDLLDVVRTQQTRWYRFLSQDDRYDPDRITFDKELLRRHYLKNGYADFQVLSAQAELTPDRKQFFITFTVEEGQRYKFGEVAINANLRDLKAEDLASKLKIQSGDWYDVTFVDDGVDALTNAVGDFGYAFVDVRPDAKRNRETGVIDMTFEVSEGRRVFVERINVNGNVRTLDEVVRREFRVVEGDAFNAAKIRRSVTRVEDLDFFNKVTVTEAEGSTPDKAVIDVEVEEKSTGSLSVGGGFSSAEGALAEVSIRERNLLGKGQDLSLGARISQRSSQVNLSFTEPYFLNREVAAGFDIYHTASDLQTSSSFDSEQTGLTLRSAYPITSYINQGWSYTIKDSKVSNVADDASIYIKEQAGAKLVSSVGHVLSYDRRNSRVTPTEGYVVRMNNDVAGLAGDVHYLRNMLSGAYHYTISEGWVVNVKGRGGIITGLGEDVGLLDRYFIGGDSLRGFADAGLGPRDRLTGDALGGEVVYNGGAELMVPLGLPQELGISGKVFSDVGSVTTVSPSGANVLDSGALRASAGVGVAWVSPIGPISLDFGQALIKESYDETEVMRVNFGTKF
ncbi:MAG: outer membrane protein assembly factor BamA [Rhodospirillales bacterium]|nr:outer membrane protein assembly factor BamA [Rhodospirillales bacterium]